MHDFRTLISEIVFRDPAHRSERVLSEASGLLNLKHYLFRDGSNLVHLAVNNNNLIALRFLHKKGVNCWQPNQDGIYPIDLAARAGYVDVIVFLLQHISLIQRIFISPIDSANVHGSTLLHDSLQHMHYPSCKMLLKKGASIRHCNNRGENAIHLAVLTNNHGLLLLILNHFVKQYDKPWNNLLFPNRVCNALEKLLDERDIMGRSPLLRLFEHSKPNAQLCKTLLKHHAAPNAVDNNRKGILQKALCYMDDKFEEGQQTIATLLLGGLETPKAHLPSQANFAQKFAFGLDLATTKLLEKGFYRICQALATRVIALGKTCKHWRNDAPFSESPWELPTEISEIITQRVIGEVPVKKIMSEFLQPYVKSMDIDAKTLTNIMKTQLENQPIRYSHLMYISESKAPSAQARVLWQTRFDTPLHTSLR